MSVPFFSSLRRLLPGELPSGDRRLRTGEPVGPRRRPPERDVNDSDLRGWGPEADAADGGGLHGGADGVRERGAVGGGRRAAERGHRW